MLGHLVVTFPLFVVVPIKAMEKIEATEAWTTDSYLMAAGAFGLWLVTVLFTVGYFFDGWVLEPLRNIEYGECGCGCDQTNGGQRQ